MSTRRFHRFRLTIGELMLAVAMLAVAYAWPVLLLPTVTGMLNLCLHRLGFTLPELLIINVILGVILGFSIPPVLTDCLSGGPTPGGISPDPSFLQNCSVGH